MRKNIRSTVIKKVLLAVLLFCIITPYAQNISREQVSISKLIELSEETEFNGLSSLLYSDEENDYFAVNTKSVESRFVKIRMFELSYENNILVNIGSHDNLNYMYFLVNKVHETSHEEFERKIADFKDTAIVESNQMNGEQMRLWLLQHDKYNQ